MENNAGKIRIRSLDLARGLAVLFMVCQHILIVHGTPEANTSAFGRIVLFLGTVPVAPVFMVLMGAFFVRSGKGFGAKMKRGAGLLILGYALNFLRLSLPGYMGLRLGLLSPEGLGFGVPLLPFDALFIVDILQFAGLAYMAMAVVEKFVRRRAVWTAIAALVALLSPLLWGVETGMKIPDFFFNLLWGDGPTTVFPFFPWIAYPLVGMAAAGKLPGGLKKEGIALASVGAVLISAGGPYFFGSYYRGGPGMLAFSCGFVFLWLIFCEWLSGNLPAAIGRPLVFWSRNILAAYFFQWVLIGWAVIPTGGMHKASWPALAGGTVLVLVLMHALTVLYGRIRTRAGNQRGRP